ncbi:glycoprotein precursor, partial [Burana virus]
MARACFWAVALLLLLPDWGLANKSSPSPTNSTPVTSAASPAKPNTTASSGGFFTNSLGSIVYSFNSLKNASLQYKSRVLNYVNNSVQQIKSWGTGMVSFVIPYKGKANNSGQMAILSVKVGQSYDQLKQKFGRFNTTGWFNLLGKKIVLSVAEGMQVMTDGLGGLLSDPTLRITGSTYIIRPRKGGVPLWNGLVERMPPPTCAGSKIVRNSGFRSFNVEAQLDKQEPLVVIAYSTAHLGLEVEDCWATVESHDYIALLADNTRFIRPNLDDDSLHYPIIHITVNKHHLSKVCRVTMCSIREPQGPSTVIQEAKIEKVVVEIHPTKAVRHPIRKLLSVSQDIVKEPCSTGTKVVSVVKLDTHTANNSNPGPYKSICNGTKIVNGFAPPELGCYSVSRKTVAVQCPTEEKLTTKEYGDCTFKRSSQNCNYGYLCITVSTPGRGTVKISSGEAKDHQDCNKECDFTIKGFEAVLTCPNGEKHQIISSEVETNCPLHTYGHLPIWVCRMSFRPVMVYTLLAWYFLGYAAWRLCFFVICTLLRLGSFLTRCTRVRMDKTRGLCECCGEWVPTKYHWQRHESCRNGRCPYCRAVCSTEKLKKHVKDCIERENRLREDEEAVTIKYIPSALRVTTIALSTVSKIGAKLMWLVGLFVIFYLCIHPVYAIKDTAVEEDLWAKEVDFVNHCSSDCVQGEEDCTCLVPAEPAVVTRKLQSIFPDFEALKRLASHHQGALRPASKKRSIDVTAPWSTVYLQDAFAPSYSGKHISLSWTETSSSGEHITVNGKSEAILKLEAGTSFMWEITSPTSSEKRRVFLSILDHTQVYNTRFLYATGDRLIESWMHGRCTGSCPDKCSCDDHLCHHSEYDDFTNWRCNPTWCWNIGTGCACCALGIKQPFTDWFISKWELEYISSPVIACIETSPDDRICQEVSAGTVLQLESISVQFSDPTGIEKKLPKEVALVHKMPGLNIFDLSKKIKLVDGRTLCDIQSCTHGPAGDIQFYSISSLFDQDHINLNKLSKKTGLNKTNSWASWSGVTSYYTCHPGHWPDCHSTGVVMHNAEAFENLMNQEDLGESYFFHEEKMYVNRTPTLSIKGRPSFGAGQITALLDVQGMMLKATHVKPDGLTIDLSSCKGCFGCSQGFTCVVRVKITKPDTFTIHLLSKDPDIIVPSTSINAKSDSTTTHEMHFFSTASKSEVCVETEEVDSSGKRASSCCAAQLSEQKAVVLENRRTLHSTSDANCTTGYFTCVGSNLSSFFSSIGAFFRRYFGSIWAGIVTAVLLCGVVALAILFGPQIFSLCLICCRKRSGYRRLQQFESLRAEWTEARKSVEEEKKKNKAVEQYLAKLSKAK